MPNREYESRETNQNRNGETRGSFLLGALLGGVVGAAAALLFAPKAGKDLRNTISHNAGSIVNKTGQLSETVKNKGNELTAKTSSLSQGIVHYSNELLNKVKEKTRTPDETGKESESQYISIGSPGKSTSKQKDKDAAKKDDEIRKKIMETEKAFDEEESRMKQ